MREHSTQIDWFRDGLVFSEPARSADDTDAYGEPVMVAGKTLRRQGSVTETSMREALRQGALHGMGKALLRVRFDDETSGITAGWTVEARGETWNIEAVYQARRREILEMVITRGVAV